jgi:hypothetical protein
VELPAAVHPDHPDDPGDHSPPDTPGSDEEEEGIVFDCHVVGDGPADHPQLFQLFDVLTVWK